MFRSVRSIQLVRIAGIRVGVDPTWFLMLFGTIFVVSSSFRHALDSSTTVAYATTVVTVLLFFASLILHELGHAVAARREGIAVERIELFLFGGITQMGRDTVTPGEEFRIALAGPLGTFAFALACAGVDLLIVGPNRLWDAIVLNGRVHLTPVLLALSWLLVMNVAILAFNLVPAYPLDGGRIARAFVWRRTASKLEGTRAAAGLGRWLALALAGFGLFLVLRQQTFSGLWLMLIGAMVFNAARSSLRQSQMTARMEAIRVSDIMDHEPVLIGRDICAEEALERSFRRYGVAWLPVVDASGRYVGIAQRTALEEAAASGRRSAEVASLVELDASDPRVDAERPLNELLTLPALGRLGGLVAIDDDGVVRGVVTLEQIRRTLAALFPAKHA